MSWGLLCRYDKAEASALLTLTNVTACFAANCERVEILFSEANTTRQASSAQECQFFKNQMLQEEGDAERVPSMRSAPLAFLSGS